MDSTVDAVKIKSKRKQLRLTLAEAAIKAGWGKGGLTRWHDIEAGRRTNLTMNTIDAIAKALGCVTTELIKSEPQEPKPVTIEDIRETLF